MGTGYGGGVRDLVRDHVDGEVHAVEELDVDTLGKPKTQTEFWVSQHLRSREKTIERERERAREQRPRRTFETNIEKRGEHEACRTRGKT